MSNRIREKGCMRLKIIFQAESLILFQTYLPRPRYEHSVLAAKDIYLTNPSNLGFQFDNLGQVSYFQP